MAQLKNEKDTYVTTLLYSVATVSHDSPKEDNFFRGGGGGETGG